MGAAIKAVIEVVKRVAVGAVRTAKSPYGQGVVTGALAASGVEHVKETAGDAVNKGNDVIKSLAVLCLVGTVAYLVVKK